MKSMIKKAVVTGAAAAASVGLGIGPAAAAMVTVSGGPNFTAVSTNTVLKSGSLTVSCTKATAAGTVSPGSYTVPAQIGTLTSSNWGVDVSTSDSCTAYGVPAFVKQIGTWQLWATGAQGGGVTPGEIRSVNAIIQVPSVGCTVTVTGTAPVNWNNTQVLTFTGGSLATAGTGFCLGLGLTGSLSGSFNVTGSPSAISIL